MPHLFLYGPPGTGKSTIGQHLAHQLGLPFIDLDRHIEKHAGLSITHIMQTQGEAAFRDLESRILQTTLASLDPHQDVVIALGGGALLRAENRTLVEAHGRVLLLMAELSTLLERLSQAPNTRPLLAGDLAARLAELLAARREHYLSFPRRLHVDGKTAEQNARHAQVLLGRYRLRAMGDCQIIVERLAALSPVPNALLVTDQNVARHHLHTVQAVFGSDLPIVILPPGEEHKTLQTVHRLWDAFLEHGLDRHSTVLALGGGVITDLTGFAAATYLRGIAWIALPTTVIGMADAAIGGKTGVDLPQGKNLVGSFHSPQRVWADPSLLHTLSDRDLRAGLAEVVKHGLIADPDLFEHCRRGLDWVNTHLEEIIQRAMAVKVAIVEEDPYEKGRRAVLNLGHTVGHAVELVSGFRLRHGEAIAIGMAVEARYAARVGLARSGLVEALEETLIGLGLPVRIPSDLSREALLQAMWVDKKKQARSIRFALPVEVGRVELVSVSTPQDVLEGEI